MKRLLTALIFISLTAAAMAQDVDTLLLRSSYKDTLSATGAIDTVDVAIRSDELRLDFHSIVCWTPSGTDTVKVYTLALDGTTWVQVGLTDLSSGSDVTQIIITTAAKEFQILDPRPIKVRLIDPTSLGGDAVDVIFIVGGKRTFD